MRRVQVRCGRTTACVAGVLLAAIAAFAASAAVARTWKSKAGSYQVERPGKSNGRNVAKAGGDYHRSLSCACDARRPISILDARCRDRSGKVVGEEAPEAVCWSRKSRRTFADLSAESNECAAADGFLPFTRNSWPIVPLTRANCSPRETTCRSGKAEPRRRWWLRYPLAGIERGAEVSREGQWILGRGDRA